MTQDYYAASLRIFEEAQRAAAKFDPFNSAHEGYAVLAEEVDELWDEVKADRLDLAIEEAVQVGAMAIRFVAEMTAKREAQQAASAKMTEHAGVWTFEPPQGDDNDGTVKLYESKAGPIAVEPIFIGTLTYEPYPDDPLRGDTVRRDADGKEVGRWSARHPYGAYIGPQVES